MTLTFLQLSSSHIAGLPSAPVTSSVLSYAASPFFVKVCLTGTSHRQ